MPLLLQQEKDVNTQVQKDNNTKEKLPFQQEGKRCEVDVNIHEEDIGIAEPNKQEAWSVVPFEVMYKVMKKVLRWIL